MKKILFLCLLMSSGVWADGESDFSDYVKVTREKENSNQKPEVNSQTQTRSMYVLKNKDGETILTNVTDDSHFKDFDRVLKKTWYSDDIGKLTIKQLQIEIEKLKKLSVAVVDEDGYKIPELERSDIYSKINEYQTELDRRVLAAKPNIKLGMTQKQVSSQSNWGKPNDVNRTTASYGVHEQWVYEGKGYLYFENGKLVTIQD